MRFTWFAFVSIQAGGVLVACTQASSSSSTDYNKGMFESFLGDQDFKELAGNLLDLLPSSLTKVLAGLGERAVAYWDNDYEDDGVDAIAKEAREFVVASQLGAQLGAEKHGNFMGHNHHHHQLQGDKVQLKKKIRSGHRTGNRKHSKHPHKAIRVSLEKKVTHEEMSIQGIAEKVIRKYSDNNHFGAILVDGTLGDSFIYFLIYIYLFTYRQERF